MRELEFILLHLTIALTHWIFCESIYSTRENKPLIVSVVSFYHIFNSPIAQDVLTTLPCKGTSRLW